MGKLNQMYKNIIDKYFQSQRRRMIAWTALFFAALLLILSSHFVPVRTSWEVGRVSTQDVQADRYLTFVDEEGTLDRQQEALKSFQDIYKIDLEKFNSITITDISDSFATLEEIAELSRSQEEVTTVDKIALLHDAFAFTLEADEWASLANLSEADIQWLYERGIDYTIDVMSKGVALADLESAREKIAKSISNDKYITGAEEKFLQAVIEDVNLYPTYVLDAEATAEKKSEILATVEPEKITVQKGELVVRKGEILTERQATILQQLGYSQSASPVIVVFGLAILIAIMILVVRAFMMHFTPKIYRDEKQLVLMMLLTTATIFLYDMFLSLTLSSIAERAAQVGYLIPVAMGTMLITILLDVRLGLVIDIILAIFVGMYTENSAFAVVALIGGLTGSLGVATLGQRSDISRTALSISAVNACLIIGLGMIQSQTPDVILFGVVFGVSNGLISSIFTMGVLPYLENIFGIATRKRGTIKLNGKVCTNRNARESIKNGFALLTEERRATGIFGILSIRENTVISSLKRHLKAGIYLNDKTMKEDTQRYIEAMRTKTPTQDTKIRSLSGGNQQKVILSRWLLTEPDVLLLDEPTRGIDVGAKYEIYQLIIDLANKGKTVIMVSSEMPELLGTCDRILVMSGGRLAGEVDAKNTSQEEIMTLAAKYV